MSGKVPDNKDVIKITLTNDYHGSEATVKAVRQLNGSYCISRRAVLRARAKLCGIKGCTCGDYCGTRPRQTEPAYGGEARILQLG